MNTVPESDLPTIAHGHVTGEWLARTTEDVIEPGLRIIDPHHHFSEHWGGYFADDLLRDTGAGHDVRSTVYIQCGYGYRDHGPEAMKPVGETERVVGIAEAAAGKRAVPRIAAGVVGYADLRLGEQVDAVLAAHVEAGKGRFRGIRNSGARHDAFRHGVLARPPANLYSDKSFRLGFSRLAKYGLSFDVWVYHPQLAEVRDLARAFPHVPIVLDHIGALLGVGPYKGKRDEAAKEWRPLIEALAACPNVAVKLGGLGTAVFGYDFHERDRPPLSQELADAWRPWFHTCIELFGADRCMFESNFPVDKVSFSHPVLFNAFKRFSKDYSSTERAAMFHDTAVKAYRIRYD